MSEADANGEQSPLEAFIAITRTELEQVRTEVSEIGMLVEQSQGEVDKLAKRNASITTHLHQIQAHFDSMPREDIRSTYEAFQDAQQRLFTMRGQLEKLQSDEAHLNRYEKFLVKTLQIVEGRPALDIADLTSGGDKIIQEIIEAQENERRTISRQIHDGPAQVLSNFILHTEIALRLFDTDQDQAREELTSLKAAATSAFSQVRDFIFDLRPMMLDDLGMVPTVRRYSEAFKEKTGLDINLVITGTERRLEPHREVLIFRATQSLLRNVRDHAQATEVKIMLDLGEHLARVSVEDNGRGFDPELISKEEEKKYSLPMLQERIEMVGGSLELESAAGEGTRVAFSIPTGD